MQHAITVHWKLYKFCKKSAQRSWHLGLNQTPRLLKRLYYSILLYAKLADRFIQFRLFFSMSDNNAYKLCDASKQQISFGSPHGKWFAIRNTIWILNQVDCSFYYHAVAVKVVPMHSATCYSRAEAEILVWAGVCVSAAGCACAWLQAGAKARRCAGDQFWLVAHPLETLRAVPAAGRANIGERGPVDGADRSLSSL